VPRYVLVIEYDGTPFCGWQRQAGALSVQQVVEEAIGKMSGETATIQAAGRTDAGVHALGQVVSFDLSKEWDPFRIREALNFHTKPHPVAIVEAGAVPDSFEARFSAIARHYEYRILNRRGRPALEDRRVWHCPIALDAEAMHAGAQHLIGKHDFTTFRSTECQAKSPEKTLDRLDVSRAGDEVHVSATARSFLHNQVRSMVGSLVLVGDGKWSPDDLRKARDACDRAACGPVAPPDGLYLMKVDY
jgi:tRNA pseudouridine38-40 synthase